MVDSISNAAKFEIAKPKASDEQSAARQSAVKSAQAEAGTIARSKDQERVRVDEVRDPAAADDLAGSLAAAIKADPGSSQVHQLDDPAVARHLA